MTDSGPARTVLFGSSAFCLPTLERLAAETDLVAAYTRPPRPAGRKGALRETPVATAARALGLEARTPSALRGPDAERELRSLEPDFCVVASFGATIPDSLLAVPLHGFWNVHPSLLPRWRGAAPVQRAILAGDRTTGVSIMKVVTELDAGPVAAAVETPIGETETAGELENRLASDGATLLLRTLARIREVELREQDPACATYAAKIGRADERIDWREDSAAVLRRIRALCPRPGAWCLAGGERIRIYAATAAAGSGEPGEALDDAFRVACGSGAILVLQAQRPGRRCLPAAELLRGFPVLEGTILE